MDNYEDRYFSPEPSQRGIARELYESVRRLPLICPHGHVDPRVLADPDYSFGSPVDLFIIPDHYIFRMLYSQGISLESLAIPTLDGMVVETDHRKVWQSVCDHWYLFRGTPTGAWMRDELHNVFGITQPLNTENSQAIYDAIADKLNSPAFRPRALFEQFDVEILATTDAATDTLAHHQSLRDSGWQGRVVPTFRPDAVVNIDSTWLLNIQSLSAVSGIDINDYASYIAALENRRAFFKHMGATATDHAATTAYTEHLTPQEADAIFQRALHQQSTAADASRFTGHMLIEMARMSVDDHLVMQLHVGSYRDHNPLIRQRFGKNMGADIPIAMEFTRDFLPFLEHFGNRTDLTVVLFNLDESTYSRELAPLAGHYPALRLGPPWWFFDSFNGMRRYFDAVMETAGIYNTAGFNDDTRAYISIPARHDLWRRAAADWLAGLVVRNFITRSDAFAMCKAMSYDLAKQTYNM